MDVLKALASIVSIRHQHKKTNSHYDWRPVSQSVCLDLEHLPVLMTRCLLLFDSYCCVSLWAPSLTRGRQHQSQSHITTDNQSDSPSWCQAPIWDSRPIFLSPRDFLLDSYSFVNQLRELRQILKTLNKFSHMTSSIYAHALFHGCCSWKQFSVRMEDIAKETNSLHGTKQKTNKTNSMVWVRERTIPTERPPLVGEVTANFCGQRVPRGQRDGFLWPYSRLSRQEPLLFYQVAPQLYSRGWVDPVPDPLLLFLVVPGIEPGVWHQNKTQFSYIIDTGRSHGFCGFCRNYGSPDGIFYIYTFLSAVAWFPGLLSVITLELKFT
jgi:hypothetical protein